jgi:hypothetical protein
MDARELQSDTSRHHMSYILCSLQPVWKVWMLTRRLESLLQNLPDECVLDIVRASSRLHAQTLIWVLFLPTLYCDVDKESSHTPGEERVLLLFIYTEIFAKRSEPQSFNLRSSDITMPQFLFFTFPAPPPHQICSVFPKAVGTERLQLQSFRQQKEYCPEFLVARLDTASNTHRCTNCPKNVSLQTLVPQVHPEF